MKLAVFAKRGPTGQSSEPRPVKTEGRHCYFGAVYLEDGYLTEHSELNRTPIPDEANQTTLASPATEDRIEGAEITILKI